MKTLLGLVLCLALFFVVDLEMQASCLERGTGFCTKTAFCFHVCMYLFIWVLLFMFIGARLECLTRDKEIEVCVYLMSDSQFLGAYVSQRSSFARFGSNFNGLNNQ